MAEPVSKVTVASVIFGGTSLAVFAPLIAETSVLFIGAVFGAVLGLSIGERMPWGWPPVRKVLCGVAFAAIATPAAVTLALFAVNKTLGGQVDLSRMEVMPFCAGMLAMFWRQILTAVPTMLRRWVGGKGDAQ